MRAVFLFAAACLFAARACTLAGAQAVQVWTNEAACIGSPNIATGAANGACTSAASHITYGGGVQGNVAIRITCASDGTYAMSVYASDTCVGSATSYAGDAGDGSCNTYDFDTPSSRSAKVSCSSVSGAPSLDGSASGGSVGLSSTVVLIILICGGVLGFFCFVYCIRKCCCSSTPSRRTEAANTPMRQLGDGANAQRV